MRMSKDLSPNLIIDDDLLNGAFGFHLKEGPEALRDRMRKSGPEVVGLAFSVAVDRSNIPLASEMLKEPLGQENYNFGLQSACSRGCAPLAQALLPLSSLISVSRSIIKASHAESPECLAILFPRLDAEQGWIPFDNALALREAAASKSQACLSMVAERSAQGELDWALREMLLRGNDEGFCALRALGADPDAIPPWKPASSAGMGNPSSREAFKAKRALLERQKSPAAMERIALAMDLAPAPAAAAPTPRL